MARRGEYRLVLSADGRILRQELKKSEGDLKQFEGGVKKASDELRRMGASAQQDLAGPLGKLGGALTAIGPAGLAAAAGIGAIIGAVGAAGAALLDATKSAVAYGSNISDLAAKNQMGVETFQALSQGMALTGVSMEQIQKATTEMQKELVKSPETFKKLGLEAERLRAMDPADAFLKTAQAVASIEDPASRTAAAFEVFGKAGASVAGAAAQMGDAAERAKTLGNVMSADVVGGLDKTGDAAQTLGVTWEHLWLNIGAAIGTAPGVAESIDKITEAIGSISTMIQDNQPVIQGLVEDVFPAIAGAVVLVTNGIKTLIGVMGQLKGAWDVDLPPWVKSAMGASGAGAVMDFLKGASGVTPGSKSKVAVGITTGAPLIGPGVGKKRGGAGGRAKTDTRAQAMADVMKAAKKDSDEFWRDQEKLASDAGKKALATLLSNQKAMAGVIHASGANAAGMLSDAEKLAGEKGRQVLEDLLDRQDQAERAFQELMGRVQDVANGFDSLGAAVGGALGDVMKFVGGTISGLGSIAQNIKNFKTSGGGFSGILGKVGASLGIAGAAFSIGKSIFGGIKSLFGGKKKIEETPVKSLAEQFDEVRKASEKAGTVGSKALRSIIDQARSAKEKVPEVEAFIKEQIGKATAAMGGITGTLKDGKITGGINIATPESAKAQATIFTSTFWAAVKEQGLVSAVDALSAPFQALREKLTSGGFDVGALLGGVGGIFDAIGGEDSPVRAALEGADALKAALEGVANAGYLTAGSFGAFQTSAQDAFNQAVSGGLSNQQALLTIAPLLGSIISASNEYGIAIDANTQALIDQAKEAGAAFPADPILQMRDAVRELVNEIRTLNGLPQKDWGPGPQWAGGPSSTTDQPAKGAPSDYVSAAKGFSLQKLARNTRIDAHKDEYAMVVPKGEPITFSGSSISSGSIGATIPSGESSTGGMTISPQITMSVDTHGEAKSKQRFLEEIEEHAYRGILQGTSKILKGFQERGGFAGGKKR